MLNPTSYKLSIIVQIQSVDANLLPCPNTYHERYRCGGEFACIVNLCSTQKLRLGGEKEEEEEEEEEEKKIPHYFLGKIYMKKIGVSLDMLERKQKPAPALN
jgi:hypothetical protein